MLVVLPARFFNFYNIKLLSFIYTLTLTLTLHIFRLLLFTFIARSRTFGTIRLRAKLLWNCTGWLPSAVAVGFFTQPAIRTIPQELYPNPRSNKNVQLRAINAPVSSDLNSYKLSTP